MKIVRGYVGCMLVTTLVLSLSYSVYALDSKNPRVKPAISLVASVLQNTAKVGSPVHVQIKITNNTDHLVFLDRNWLSAFDVRNAAGVQPLTRRGEILLKNAPRNPGEDSGLPLGGGPSLQLGPHKTEIVSPAVSDLFNLSQPGTYSIQIHVPDPTGTGAVVKSNIISITIVP